MKKPEQLLGKLGFLAAFGGILWLWYFFDLPCVPRTLTGIPCPTCGLTRAWLAAFHLQFGVAFRHYPMFWSIPVLVFFYLYDGKPFPGAQLNGWILGTILAGIFLIWLARLFGFLGILLPL